MAPSLHRQGSFTAGTDDGFSAQAQYCLTNRSSTPLILPKNARNFMTGVKIAPRVPAGHISDMEEMTAPCMKLLGMPLLALLPSLASPYRIYNAFSNLSSAG